MPDIRLQRRISLAAVTIILACCGRSPPEGDSSTEDAPASSPAITYECESGRIIEASYPSESTAAVEYEGETFQMTIAISASGARYVGGGLEWWTRAGREGALFRHEAGGTAGEIIEQCERSVPE